METMAPSLCGFSLFPLSFPPWRPTHQTDQPAEPEYSWLTASCIQHQRDFALVCRTTTWSVNTWILHEWSRARHTAPGRVWWSDRHPERRHKYRKANNTTFHSPTKSDPFLKIQPHMARTGSCLWSHSWIHFQLCLILKRLMLKYR